MPTIVGAGAIGLALGARLAHAGLPVRFVTRRAEASRRLAAEGVLAEDPGSGERIQAKVEAGTELGPRTDEPLLLCVRWIDLAALADALARQAPGQEVVAFQNDVDGEELLAARELGVIGGVWRQTCTRADDRSARFLGRGRLVVGRHPARAASGHDPALDRVSLWLERAGYDVGISDRIGADKWLKLCVNLMSAPNALVRRDDHETQAFVEIKLRVLREARAILEAAGVEASSCDGRDRSVDEEIAFQAESLARGTSARRLPIYNQVWATLRHGREPESVRYHARFVAMAQAHGLHAKANARVAEMLRRACDDSLGPECYAASELLGDG